MRRKRPAHRLPQSSPSVNTDSLPPAVPEKVGLGLWRQETFPEFLHLAGPFCCRPPSYPRVEEALKFPEKQGCLSLTSYSPSTSTPVSRALVTSVPLVPAESLEHNDKAPAGAAKGPPLTDDNKVRLVLGIHLPAPLGSPLHRAGKSSSAIRKNTGLGKWKLSFCNSVLTLVESLPPLNLGTKWGIMDSAVPEIPNIQSALWSKTVKRQNSKH